MPLAELDQRYALEQLIARGGMADVYRATDLQLGRPVAVKQMREPTASATDQDRFTTEARTLSRLNHPGLVTVLDAGVDDDRPYLVMELVPGRTLADRCGDGPVPVAEVADIGAQLADALAYAHRSGVVHRDVKPGNVLLGDDGRVRLADFGIARIIGDGTRHTATGLTVGTAAYLSPEQVRGTEVSPAADLYALGLVLLEALTGTRSYPGPPDEAALARLTRRPTVPGRLAPSWRRLLRQLTALDPARRPTAGQTAASLRRLARVADAAALDTAAYAFTPGTDSPSSRTGRRIRLPLGAVRRGRLVPVAAALTVVLAVGAVAWPHRGPVGDPPAAHPDHPSVQRRAAPVTLSPAPEAVASTPDGSLAGAPDGSVAAQRARTRPVTATPHRTTPAHRGHATGHSAHGRRHQRGPRDHRGRGRGPAGGPVRAGHDAGARHGPPH